MSDYNTTGKYSKKDATQMARNILDYLHKKNAKYEYEDKTEQNGDAYYVGEFYVHTELYTFSIRIDSNKTYTDITFDLDDDYHPVTDYALIRYYGALLYCGADPTIPISYSIMLGSSNYIEDHKITSKAVQYYMITYVIDALLEPSKCSYEDDVKRVAMKFLLQRSWDKEVMSNEVVNDPIMYANYTSDDNGCRSY